MTRLFMVVLLLHSSMIWILAQNTRETMSRANEAFTQEQYDTAVALYQRLLSDGWQSADLYYNLGIAQYRKNDLASARFHLERARLLSPNDESILHNLEQVKDRVGDYYIFPAYPLFGLIEWIHSVFGRSFAAWLLLLLYLAAVLALWRWHHTRDNWIKVLGICFFGLFLCMLIIFLFEQAYFRFHARMAVVSNPTTLMVKPDESSELVRNLQPGFKVRIHEIVGDWATIELADGSAGWLKQDVLLPLDQKIKAGG